MKRVPEGGPNDIRHNLNGIPRTGNPQAGTIGGADTVVEVQVYLIDISDRSCGLSMKNDSACH